MVAALKKKEKQPFENYALKFKKNKDLLSKCAKDTLSRGRLCVFAGWCRCLHLLCIGKLCQETCLEVFSPLILLPAVNEHFVLKDTEEDTKIVKNIFMNA